MSGKFMKVLKIAIPTLTLVLIASQLLNACAVSPSELLSMYERQQAIEIEVAYPESQEQGTEKILNWTELAYLNNYPEFREVFDDTLGIIQQGTAGKNGVVYVDLNSNHTNNSTLRYAFANAKFHSVFWNNNEAITKITSAINKVYADVDGTGMTRSAIINAYFNIFPDADPNYFNGNQTLTRGEFLAGVYRAGNPVSDLTSDYNFESLVDPAGTDQSTVFASQLQDYSYFTLEDQSLNSGTFQGTITRAEAIYTLVKLYFSDAYNATTGSESAYSDASNGGDIALKAGFKDKETGALKSYWKSYELSYALQHADKGLPTDLYRALVVSKNNNIITGSESRWDEGLTKNEAITLITNVYEALGTYISADRGASTGTVVDNTNTGSKDNINSDNQTVERPQITPKDFTTDENGKLFYTMNLIEFVKSFDGFKDLTNEDICRIIESEVFKEYMIMAEEMSSMVDEAQKDFVYQFTIEYDLSRPLCVERLMESAKAVVRVPSSPEIDTTAGNTGGGSTSVTDNNKGGSDENEAITEENNPGGDVSDNVENPTISLEESTDETDYRNKDNEYKMYDTSMNMYTILRNMDKIMYTTENVGTRIGPSTNFDRATIMYSGEQVQVLGECVETGWYLIKYGTQEMFINSYFLSDEAPVFEEITPTPAPTTAPSQDNTSSTDKVTPTPKPSTSEYDKYYTKGRYTYGIKYGETEAQVTVNGKTFIIPLVIEDMTAEIRFNSSEECMAWCQIYTECTIKSDPSDWENEEVGYIIPDVGSGGKPDYSGPDINWNN